MRDFVTWEPGLVVTCALCGKERGGADPPGPWTRRYRDGRRRIPIVSYAPNCALGYMEYVNR